MKRNLFIAIIAGVLSLSLSSCGCTGPTGSKGEVGLQGEKGDKGEKGDPGTPGKDGKDGETGPQGPAGETGPQGPQGEPGKDGQPGAKGDKGDKGEAGPAGQDGADGQDGATGPSGPKGDKGDTGPAGQDGTNGQDGADGQNGKSSYESYKEKYGYQGTEENYLYDLSHNQLGDKNQYTIKFLEVSTYTLPEKLEGYKGIGAKYYKNVKPEITLKNGSIINDPNKETIKHGYTYFGWFDIDNPEKPVDFTNLRAYKDMELVYGMIPDNFIYADIDASSTDGYIHAAKKYTLNYNCYNVKSEESSVVDSTYRDTLLMVNSTNINAAVVTADGSHIDTKNSGEFNLRIRKTNENISFEQTYNVVKIESEVQLELVDKNASLLHLHSKNEYRFNILFKDSKNNLREATDYEKSILAIDLTHSSGENRCSFDINRGSFVYSDKDSTFVTFKTKGSTSTILNKILLVCDDELGWLSSFNYLNLKELTSATERGTNTKVRASVNYNFPMYPEGNLNDVIARGIYHWKSSNPEVAEVQDSNLVRKYKGTATIGLYDENEQLVQNSEFKANVLLGEPRIKVRVNAPSNYKYQLILGRYLPESAQTLEYMSVDQAGIFYTVKDTGLYDSHLGIIIKDTLKNDYLLDNEYTVSDPRFEAEFNAYASQPVYHLGPLQDDVNLVVNVSGYKEDFVTHSWSALLDAHEEVINEKASSTGFAFYDGVTKYSTELRNCDTIVNELNVESHKLSLNTRTLDAYGIGFISTKIYIELPSDQQTVLESRLVEQFMQDNFVSKKAIGGIPVYYNPTTGECFNLSLNVDYNGTKNLLIETIVNAKDAKDLIKDNIN